MYLVIGTTDDGSFIESLTKDELEARLTGTYYGEHVTFLTEIPSVSLVDWPSCAVLIVRAAAFTVPRTETIVTHQVLD